MGSGEEGHMVSGEKQLVARGPQELNSSHVWPQVPWPTKPSCWSCQRFIISLSRYHLISNKTDMTFNVFQMILLHRSCWYLLTRKTSSKSDTLMSITPKFRVKRWMCTIINSGSLYFIKFNFTYMYYVDIIGRMCTMHAQLPTQAGDDIAFC